MATGSGHESFGGVTPSSAAWMLALAVIWGLSIPITKLGLETLLPLTLTALRFAIAVPLLLAFGAHRRLPRRAWPRVAALGGLGIGVGQVTQTLGIEGTTASVGTIVSATIPLFVVVFAAVRLKQAVTIRQRIGLVAAFVGIALVAAGQGGDTAPSAGSTPIGVVWLLISSLAIAVYYVWSVELTRDFGTAAVAAWSTVFGFVSLLPWTAWEIAHVPIRLTTEGLVVAAYLGVAVTVAGLFLWLHLLRTVPARTAAAVQYLQPVVGIAAAAAMFGDALGGLFAAGVGLILAGLALAVAGPRGRR